jgi:hypothetical protein
MELVQLRVAKVTGGTPSKLSKMQFSWLALTRDTQSDNGARNCVFAISVWLLSESPSSFSALVMPMFAPYCSAFSLILILCHAR